MRVDWKGICGFFIIWIGIFLNDIIAQEDIQADSHEEKVEELIAFLQFSLNTIGSPMTTAREKDVIITQSYSKFFRDSEVQIEDDLDEERETVTNKDVQAYLKDIDFFFKQVSFKLEIEEIEELVSEDGQTVFLVRLNRNIEGITIDEDTVNQNITRYIEINYDEEKDDLKIVSFYTTKLSESEDLFNWWEQLSFEWRYIFNQSLGNPDSITLEFLKRADALDSLDLSNNPYLTDIEPIRRLRNLYYLDLSNTKIEDLSPLRSHTKLRYLSVRNTGVSDIDLLRYSRDLVVFDLAGSEVSSLNPISYFPNLISLNISHTPVDSLHQLAALGSLQYLDCSYSKINKLDGLEELENLRSLNISFTQIDNLEKIKGLKSLNTLNFEFTTIDNLTPIAEMDNIEVIKCENTNVYDLKQLNGLANLSRVYSDNTGISMDMAAEYMNSHPHTLIVFESEVLRKWWLELNSAWKIVLKDALHIDKDPEREELARISNIDSLNLSGLKTISDLSPVVSMRYMKYLNCHDTFIRDLSSLSGLSNLEILILSETAVEDLNPISDLRQLHILDISNSRVRDIAPINGLRNLIKLNLDGTLVDEKEARVLVQRNPACQVMYKTEALTAWWNELNDPWKEIMIEHMARNKEDLDVYLHKVIQLKNISITDKRIEDLTPLNEFFMLKNLSVEGSLVTDLTPLKINQTISYITIRRSPITDVIPLQSLPNLVSLDLGQTAIAELISIAELGGLTSLSLAGTKIRSLKLLAGMSQLEKLDISNTSVRSLNHISKGVLTLDQLVCYNTPLTTRKIESFRIYNPECEVIFY